VLFTFRFDDKTFKNEPTSFILHTFKKLGTETELAGSALFY